MSQEIKVTDDIYQCEYCHEVGPALDSDVKSHDGGRMSHREMVDRRIDELMEMARSFSMPVYRPKVVYDLSGMTAGTYDRGTNVIRINERLLIENLDEYLRQTVGHEFAHAMADQHYPKCTSHGWEWRHCMFKLGLEPIVKHHYDTTRTRVRKNRMMKVWCGCGERDLSITKYNKMVLKGMRYKCLKCNHAITKHRNIFI